VIDPRVAYNQADARGATPVRLVVLMYEQLIQDLRQAAKAIDENNIESRTNRINHALDIICVLQGTLNVERGGQVARNLVLFYEVMRSNLWQAQLYASKQILSRQITDLLTVREAWISVDRVESPKTQSSSFTIEL
jgi:flagellar protein FliS